MDVINMCHKQVCQVLIEDYTIEILWDYAKKCIVIQDGNYEDGTRQDLIADNLTIRQVVTGLGFKYMETCWSSNGEDVLDMLVCDAPLSTIRILTLDDMEICEKL